MEREADVEAVRDPRPTLEELTPLQTVPVPAAEQVNRLPDIRCSDQLAIGPVSTARERELPPQGDHLGQIVRQDRLVTRANLWIAREFDQAFEEQLDGLLFGVQVRSRRR